MKILMVCLGNICRSPLAHVVMEQLVSKAAFDWQVDSAGTGNWHVGCPPDARATAVALAYGVDISTQRAQQFHPSFFDVYDHILVMDKQNYADVLTMATTAAQRAKVALFLEDAEVPDPYFDASLFEPVYLLVAERCQQLMDRWSAAANPA